MQHIKFGEKGFRIGAPRYEYLFQADDSLAVDAAAVSLGLRAQALVELIRQVFDGQRCHRRVWFRYESILKVETLESTESLGLSLSDQGKMPTCCFIHIFEILAYFT